MLIKAGCFRGAPLPEGRFGGNDMPRARRRLLCVAEQRAEAPRLFALLVGNILYLPAAMLLHQRVIERHLFAIAELHLQFGAVVQQDRLTDLEVISLAILPGYDGIEIERADLAVRRVVEIGLEEFVQMVGEEGRIGGGGIVRGGGGVEGIEGLEEGFWGFVRCGEDRRRDQRREGDG